MALPHRFLFLSVIALISLTACQPEPQAIISTPLPPQSEPTATQMAQVENTLSPAPTPLPYPGKIAMLNCGDLLVMDADGTDPRFYPQDTLPPYLNDFAWSSDAQQIALHARVDQNIPDNPQGIYLLDLAGGAVTRVNSLPASAMSWAPDMRTFALETLGTGMGVTCIKQALIDGSAPVNIDPGKTAENNCSPGDLGNPAYSPDGTMLAVTSQWDHAIAILKTDENYTKIVERAEIPGNVSELSWSPDSQWLAFSVRNGDDQSDIYIMSWTGQDMVNLTPNTPWLDQSPTWSPDGQYIAFDSRRVGNGSLWVMNADGSNPTQIKLPGGCLQGSLPRWAPQNGGVVTPPEDPEARIRYILADSQLGGVIDYYRNETNDPVVAEAVRRWDAGVRVQNIADFERIMVNDAWQVVYIGTQTRINGMHVILTSDTALPEPTSIDNSLEARIRFIQAEFELADMVSYYREVYSDPAAVEAVRRWDAGVRVQNIADFERKIVGNTWQVVYVGTDTPINGMDVILTEPTSDYGDIILPNLALVFTGQEMANYLAPGSTELVQFSNSEGISMFELSSNGSGIIAVISQPGKSDGIISSYVGPPTSNIAMLPEGWQKIAPSYPNALFHVSSISAMKDWQQTVVATNLEPIEPSPAEYFPAGPLFFMNVAQSSISSIQEETVYVSLNPFDSISCAKVGLNKIVWNNPCTDSPENGFVIDIPTPITFADSPYIPRVYWAQGGHTLLWEIPPMDFMTDPTSTLAAASDSSSGIMTLGTYRTGPPLTTWAIPDPGLNHVAYLEQDADPLVKHLHITKPQGENDRIVASAVDFLNFSWSMDGRSYVYVMQMQEGTEPRVCSPILEGSGCRRLTGGIAQNIRWVDDNALIYTAKEPFTEEWTLILETIEGELIWQSEKVDRPIVYDFILLP